MLAVERLCFFLRAANPHDCARHYFGVGAGIFGSSVACYASADVPPQRMRCGGVGVDVAWMPKLVCPLKSGPP